MMGTRRRRMVYKMAAVGCVVEKGRMLEVKCMRQDGTMDIVGLCRKNGVKRSVLFDDQKGLLSARECAKTEKSIRLNGSSRKISEQQAVSSLGDRFAVVYVGPSKTKPVLSTDQYRTSTGRSREQVKQSPGQPNVLKRVRRVSKPSPVQESRPCIPVCKLNKKDDSLDDCLTNTTDICSPTCSSSPDSVQTLDQDDDDLDQGEDSGLESGGGGGMEQFSSMDSGLESAGSGMGQFSSTDDNSSSSCSLLSSLAADTSHLAGNHVTSFHVGNDDLTPHSNSTNQMTPDTSRSCTPISIGVASAKLADTQYKLAFPWKPHSTDTLKAEFKTPEKVKLDKTGYNSSSSSSVTPTVLQVPCKWSHCDKCLGQGAILDHIRQEHVDYQQTKETFVCLWEGCKVYNRHSCSLSWLERHVISHSGTKPFRCIVDGCLQRFTSESGLERHVNGHFNASSTTQTNSNCKGSRSREDTPTKRRKKMCWKRPWRARTDDYLNDSCILDQMKLCLIGLARNTEMDFPTTSSNNQQQLSPAVTFHSSIIGQRKERRSDSSQYLLHWMPENILPDSWVCETEIRDLKQIIPLRQLPREAITQLSPSLYRQHRFRKHRRK